VSGAGAHRPGVGIALILGTSTLFAASDTIVKSVGAVVPVLVLMWVRYTFQAATMAVWLAASPERSFRAAHPQFQIVRAVLLAMTSALAWTGVQKLPVAEFTAINMLGPLLVTLLAATMLRERVSMPRWLLVAGGFAGALIVVRPGSGLYGAAVVYPLASALSFAAFQVLTSRYSALENPLTTHFYTGLFGSVILTPMLLASGIDLAALGARIDATATALLLAVALFGTLGHLMLIFALGFAPAATLMPFLYTQIAVAAVLGWLLFSHVPDGWAFAGMGVIAVCGAASAWLNLRDSRRASSPVAADTIAE
jgi:drug/metabolite transporter (DMT)-like permease